MILAINVCVTACAVHLLIGLARVGRFSFHSKNSAGCAWQVEQMNKDYEEKRISKTDLIQKKLAAVEKHLG